MNPKSLLYFVVMISAIFILLFMVSGCKKSGETVISTVTTTSTTMLSTSTSPLTQITTQTAITTSKPPFTIITGQMSLNGEPGTVIPWGSVIYHWANGITETYGPDNALIFVAKDSEATQIIAPGGAKPATKIYALPNGAVVSNSENTTKISVDGNVILTVISKSENYQY